jgi:hypothetical protein
MHHIQRRHLLGHEQDRFPVVHGGGDDVGDGLRLAGPRRSLDDEVAARADLFDDRRLGGVGIDDMDDVRGIEPLVEPFAGREERRLRLESAREQATDEIEAQQGALRPVRRIEVAVDSRRSRDFLIVARTDARTSLGLDEALARGRAFAKAGADVVFIESPESVDEFDRVGQELAGCGAWLIANMVPSGRSPEIPVERLKKMGFSLAIWPGAAMAAACAAIEGALVDLKARGTTEASSIPRWDMTKMHELVGFPEVWEFDRRWAQD